MKITKATVNKLTLTEIEHLDPVTVIMEDFELGRGKITIDCYGKAWTAYWGGMGEQTIAEFINTADAAYIVGKISDTPAMVIDYDDISNRVGNDVDRDTAIYYEEEIGAIYGPDWRMDPPQKPNHEYAYICRIVRAVKAAVAEKEAPMRKSA